MRFVISIDGNSALRVLKAAHVHTGCASIFLQEFDKLRQVVGEVLRLLEGLEELSLMLLLGLLLLDLFLLLTLLDLAADSIAAFFSLNLFKLKDSLRKSKIIELKIHSM